jgi:hypothetical protein
MTSAARGGDTLLSELGGLLDRLDPVPPGLIDQGRQIFCWRSIDAELAAELAELSFDSLLDQDLALAVRSGDGSVLGPRMLGFGAVVDGEDLSIEVEVSATEGQCTMIGQLEPAGATTIGLQSRDGGVLEVPVDDVGRFSIRSVPSGPVRLRIEHGGRLVQTTWVSYVG